MLEPILIKAYKCPVPGCNAILDVTREKALAHANMPVDKRLKIGFVYKPKQESVFYHVIVDEGKMVSMINLHERMYRPHTFNQHELWIDVYKQETENFLREINTGQFYEGLENGENSLLNEKEFRDFKKMYKSLMQKIKSSFWLKNYLPLTISRTL